MHCLALGGLTILNSIALIPRLNVRPSNPPLASVTATSGRGVSSMLSGRARLPSPADERPAVPTWTRPASARRTTCSSSRTSSLVTAGD